ncbi:MAG: polysaccharide biosynthesis C-terminal domain-containing protein [Chitinophagales bacterium]
MVFEFSITVFFSFIFITYIFGGFLTAAGKLKQISYYAFFTIILNVVLNVFLIRKYEASGAALATIISQAVMALAQMIYVLKHFNTQFELKKMGSSFLYLLLNIGIMVLLTGINLKWNVKMLIFVIIAILLSFVLQLVKIKNISTLQ